jgi:hypothetical protein
MNRMHLSVVSVSISIGLVCSAAASGSFPGSASNSVAEATRQLKAARAAIGADATLRGLKSLVLKGTNQQPSGHSGTMVSTALEYRMQFPDRYLRIDTNQFFMRTNGITTDGAVLHWKPLKPGLKFTPPKPEPPAAPRARFARLLLGILADTSHPMSLTVRGGSTNGIVYTVDLAGDDNFSALLDLDATTHLPMRVRYEGEMAPTRTLRLSANQTTHVATEGPRVKTEIAYAFEDHHVVAGLNLPHRIRGFARDVVFEELQIEEALINPRLSAEDFSPR